MQVASFLLKESLSKDIDSELAFMITNCDDGLNGIEVLLTPNNKFYMEIENYTISDILYGNIPEETFVMHTNEQIKEVITNELLLLWDEIKDEYNKSVRKAKDYDRVKDQEKKLRKKVRELTEELEKRNNYCEAQRGEIRHLKDENKTYRKALARYKSMIKHAREKSETSVEPESVLKECITLISKLFVGK